MLQSMKDKEAEVPFDYECKDKFLIQWISIENDEKDRDVADLVSACHFNFLHAEHKPILWGMTGGPIFFFFLLFLRSLLTFFFSFFLFFAQKVGRLRERKEAAGAKA